ncbi:hypothetical protein LX36DRAFT_751220 [Colletotrichum falcatum]|nr:hypothetical protein LX36DRAFT_751220 [Colletotrichum falcatum]
MPQITYNNIDKMATLLEQDDQADSADESWTEVTQVPSSSSTAPPTPTPQDTQEPNAPCVSQQQTPPPEKLPKEAANCGTMDPGARKRLLEACTDILQIASPSPFTNQSSRDPLESLLQGLVRCAAFAVQAAAAEEKRANRKSASDSQEQEEKGGLTESDAVQH